jgi:large subunit ribosomal protein L15
MSLNNLKPAAGSRKTAQRVGRGIGSGWGKTCGRGHKGQKSRSGGWHKVGFEGGQMPIQRRLPKFGFTSRMARRYAEVRLHELAMVEGDTVTPETLIAAGLVPLQTQTVKVILSGAIDKAVKVSGCRVTKGARAAIESAGGSISDEPVVGSAAQA